MTEWLPPFASGKIVGSYDPLKKYLEVARRRGREDLIEKALIGDDDLRLLRELTYRRGVSVDSLMAAFESRFYERVDPHIAAEAYKSLGFRVDDEVARRMLARILAGWLIEAGEYWKLYKLQSSWENG